ncbi:hypothetical protein EBZ70_08435 [bacterium]|nr:hypothetical protein [bacterium]
MKAEPDGESGGGTDLGCHWECRSAAQPGMAMGMSCYSIQISAFKHAQDGARVLLANCDACDGGHDANVATRARGR